MKKAIMFTAMLFMLFGCHDAGKLPQKEEKIAEGRELFCLAKDQNEAEKIAADYGIELVSFGDGVAVFHTEDDPKEVIRYGQDNKLTLLSLNTEVKPIR